LLYIISLPLLLFLSTKSKYKQSIPARFFLYKNPKFKSKDKVWFHACSLGEVSALKPLIDHIGKDNVVVTTITTTGYNKAKSFGVECRYLPFEILLPFWMNNQKELVVLEAELWYFMLYMAKRMNIRVTLLNSRVSDRSFPKSLRIRWFYESVFENVDTIYAQSNKDKKRLELLGASNIEVIGNIKLAQAITNKSDFIKPSKKVIVAASTHEKEEELILKAYFKYHEDLNTKLLIVPRHPERFEKVWSLISSMSSNSARFSEDKEFNANIILVDVMGELNSIYKISDIAILGGAFEDNIGGHNPLEPAYYGCKIITGEHFFNQYELFKYVENVQVVKSNIDELVQALRRCDELDDSYINDTIELTSFYNYLEKK
jgi:3-deoxy-D-manno-octulosonic-acid transferase